MPYDANSCSAARARRFSASAVAARNFLRGIQDAPAFARNLFVARPLNFQLVLFRATRCMDQVGMRIHESRQNDAATHIKLLRLPRRCMLFDLRARTHC